ncbi:hypothetical protein pb186bvf_005103 [Paramecium bursaria]
MISLREMIEILQRCCIISFYSKKQQKVKLKLISLKLLTKEVYYLFQQEFLIFQTIMPLRTFRQRPETTNFSNNRKFCIDKQVINFEQI